jgi:tRNA(fMet)-specific endonuclease VapC
MDLALLDTDIVSEVIKQRSSLVGLKSRAYIAQHAALAFSTMSFYEIVRGARLIQATTLLKRFEIVSHGSLVIPIDNAILDRAADLWVAARRGGHADADLIIAATALENGRVLVTGNTPHFAWIPGLQLKYSTFLSGDFGNVRPTLPPPVPDRRRHWGCGAYNGPAQFSRRCHRAHSPQWPAEVQVQPGGL